MWTKTRAKAYVKRAVARMEAIGATTAVIGSGGSRSVPDGFARDQAIQQIVGFLDMVADETDNSSITLAIEPLNKKESNIINSVSEGVFFAKEVNRPSILRAGRLLPYGRRRRAIGDVDREPRLAGSYSRGRYGAWITRHGDYPYTQFVALLKQAGYDGMVSIECRWQDFEAEAKPSVEFLRSVFAG